MFDAAEIASMAAEDIVAYKSSILYEMERESEMEYAKEEAREEGREEERQESIRIMLSLGISPEVIAAQYNMTPEEVIKLLYISGCNF